MQLRYLKNITLKKSIKEKQSNGINIETYKTIKLFRIQIQELTDEVSASIYDLNINKIIHIKSHLNELENYLMLKLNNNSDNVSKYFLFLNNTKYKINSVKSNWIDIERV